MESSLAAALIPAFISAIAVGITGSVTAWLLKKQVDFDKKQHQVQGLLEAFKVLDDSKHRGARRKVYELYFEYIEND